MTKMLLVLTAASVIYARVDAAVAQDARDLSRSKLAAEINNYLVPYVQSGNFSGTVLVTRSGKTLYEKSFGFADREKRIVNSPGTRFHIASMSMAYTAAAILRLIDQGRLKMETRVADIIPGINGGDRISIRNLLEQKSGLSDINSRSDYDSIIARSQTPASLVAFIAKDSLLFEPGSKYLHEEHSAYNLLALIIERVTGKSFTHAMRDLVLAPAALQRTGVDDDMGESTKQVARGYAPLGVRAIQPATLIHWSAKTGNASIFATARDEEALVHALFTGKLLSNASRSYVMDTIPRVGYGWFRARNKRFEELAYYMNGRAPGFSSFVLYLPGRDLTVIALSNMYSSATTDIGYDIASIVTSKPYKPFTQSASGTGVTSPGLAGISFQFGPDFYQQDARLEFTEVAGELFLRWPSGDKSPMIPITRDHFIDRAYWVPVSVERDSAGSVVAITYDRFRGTRTP